jgi:hypothetical protein
MFLAKLFRVLSIWPVLDCHNLCVIEKAFVEMGTVMDPYLLANFDRANSQVQDLST